MNLEKCMMRTVFYTGFGLLVLSQTVMAGDKDSAEAFLKSKLDAIFEVLQKKDLEQQTKHDQIEEIVTPMFDFQLMAKLSLGKKDWPGLTQENRERFSELFIQRLRKSYLNKLTAYTDEKIIYKSPIEVKKKIHVPTDLVSKGKNISMLYKFHKSKNNWKIYDIEIQGVSIIRSYRSQCNEILQDGTFDDLLQKLRAPLEN